MRHRHCNCHRFQAPSLRADWLALSKSVIAVVGLALLLAGCGGEGASDGVDQAQLQAVRGQVLLVEARSLIELEALEVQDGDGVVWRFEARGAVIPGFGPSHLNKHSLLGLPVEVTFYRDGDAPVLVGITD